VARTFSAVDTTVIGDTQRRFPSFIVALAQTTPQAPYPTPPFTCGQNWPDETMIAARSARHDLEKLRR
jgi:hypothetical protein